MSGCIVDFGNEAHIPTTNFTRIVPSYHKVDKEINIHYKTTFNQPYGMRELFE